MVEDENGRFSCNMKSASLNRYYKSHYLEYDNIVYSYFPLTALFLVNNAIIAKLMKAKLSPGNTAGGVTLSKTSYTLTIMLVTICLVFGLLTLPYAILHKTNSFSTPTHALITSALYLNHAINFEFYLASNKKFRVEFFGIFCGKCASAIHPEITMVSEGNSINNTKSTKFSGHR